MIILSATNLKKEYGTDVILQDVSFHVNEGDRVGLVGVNGAGKTTLMRILAGELPYEGGQYFVSPNTTIGYLAQNNAFNSENTVFEEIDGIFSEIHRLEEDMSALSEEIAEKSGAGQDVDALLHRLDDMQQEFQRRDGYSYKSEIVGVLSSMAFTEEFYDKKISTLSGGERTRLALAALLLKKPDMLFLDEPTNHLDIGTLKWLEQYLKGYRGTILVISHDRYFLDRTVNRIFEVEHKKLYTYEGNYSEYAVKKRARREDEWRRYNAQQREIDKQEELIRRFKERGTEKLAKRAASREKRLEHLELIDRPDGETGRMKIRFKQEFKSGNDVFIGEGVSKGFGYGSNRRELFRNVAFDIKRGEKICIVGANGTGKTTLLKLLLGQLQADSGYIKEGFNVAVGYYDQGQLLLNDGNTVLEELKEAYRLYSDTEMRSILGRFLFTGEMVFLKVGSLSGGEKARLSLVKLMLTGANVLILDEPTNHLDIDSKEVFEEALLEFPGTVIVVSHDRYFLSKIPDRILELTPDGLTNYLGAYDYYQEKKQETESGKKYLSELSQQQTGKEKQAEEEQNLSAAEQRRINKERDMLQRRRQREQEKLEAEIAELEEKIFDMEQEQCNPEHFADHKFLQDLADEIIVAKDSLAQRYDAWMKLQED